MKRDPKDRGKDKWERITWDEAYDLITEKFMDMKEKYGAESVVFAQGTGRDIAAYIIGPGHDQHHHQGRPLRP